MAIVISGCSAQGFADQLRDALRAQQLPAPVQVAHTPVPGTLGAADHIEVVLGALGAASALATLAKAIATRLARPGLTAQIRVGDAELKITAEDTADRERTAALIAELIALRRPND
jgi:hypothetical protein